MTGCRIRSQLEIMALATKAPNERIVNPGQRFYQ